MASFGRGTSSWRPDHPGGKEVLGGRDKSLHGSCGHCVRSAVLVRRSLSRLPKLLWRAAPWGRQILWGLGGGQSGPTRAALGCSFRINYSAGDSIG
jgi:hypothetical protein